MATEDDRRSRVREFVRQRLRAEIANGPRGKAAEIAQRAKIAPATISNLQSPHPSRDPGNEVMHKLADYWGISYGELEAEALGLTRTFHGLEIDPDDAYPNRARAIALARLAGAQEEAITWIQKSAPEGDSDKPTTWWLLRTLAKAQELEELVSTPDFPGTQLEKKRAVQKMRESAEAQRRDLRAPKKLAKRPLRTN